jgi:hypothetical protein
MSSVVKLPEYELWVKYLLGSCIREYWNEYTTMGTWKNDIIIIIIITSILNNLYVWTGHYQFSFHCKSKFHPSQRSFMKSQIPCNYLDALILIHIQCLYKDRLHNVYNFGHLLIILLGSNVAYHSVLSLFIFPFF